MYEIILTLRPDFREKPLGRCPTAEEARDVARDYAVAHCDQVVRTWVRAVQDTTAPKSTDHNK